MTADSGQDAMDRAREIGLPLAEVDAGEKIFLRIGEWDPKNPRSRNYSVGDIEYGLSVYELDDEGNPVVPPEGEWSEMELQARLASDAPKFLVQGTVIAWGGEGEPLLDSPRVVGGYVPSQATPSPKR